jgi:hypothetical protein
MSGRNATKNVSARNASKIQAVMIACMDVGFTNAF